MPILHCARRHHARTVRADQARFRAAQVALDLHHVGDRNAFGDADDERDFRLDRLADRVGGAGRRHVDHAGVATGRRFRLCHRLEYRQVEMERATFARRRAADHLGAVGDRLLGMEGAVLAGEALADDLGVLVDEDGHFGLSVAANSVHLPLKGGGRRASAGWGSIFCSFNSETFAAMTSSTPWQVLGHVRIPKPQARSHLDLRAIRRARRSRLRQLRRADRRPVRSQAGAPDSRNQDEWPSGVLASKIRAELAYCAISARGAFRHQCSRGAVVGRGAVFIFVRSKREPVIPTRLASRADLPFSRGGTAVAPSLLDL